MMDAAAGNVLARLDTVAKLLPAVKPLVRAFAQLVLAEFSLAKASLPRLAAGLTLILVSLFGLIGFAIAMSVVALRERQVSWSIIAVIGGAVFVLFVAVGAWMLLGAVRNLTFAEARARISWLKDGRHAK